MKKLVVLFFLLASQFTVAQWESCSGTVTGEFIHEAYDFGDVLFVHTGYGFFSTSDGGNTWTKPQFQDKYCRKIIKFNNSFYFCYDTLYVTSDKGVTWNTMPTPPKGACTSIYPYKDRLYATTTEGLFLSKDSAKSWIKLETSIDSVFKYDVYVSGNNLILSGYGPEYAYCTQLGQGKWITIDSLAGLANISQYGNTLCGTIEYGKYYGAYYSDDNGLTFNRITVKQGKYDKEIDDIIAVKGGALIFNWGDHNIYKYDAVTQKVDYNYYQRDSVSMFSNYHNSYDEIHYLNSTDEKIIAVGVNRLYELSFIDSTYKVIHDRTRGFEVSAISATGNKFYSVVGRDIHLTTDNGNTWKNITEKLPATYFSKICANENTVFLSHYAPTLYLSHDNGQEWKTISMEDVEGFYGLGSLYADDENVYLGSSEEKFDRGGFFTFSEKNNFWDRIPVNIEGGAIISIGFVGKDIFIAQETTGIYVSTDYGYQWRSRYKLSKDENIKDMSIYDQTIAVLCDKYILLSEDAGKTWIKKLNNFGNSGIHVYKNLIFVTSDNIIHVSTDKGTTFKAIYESLPDNPSITGIRVCGKYLMTGTKYGPYRAKLSDFGLVSVDEVPGERNAFIVYPNPSSDYIFIKREESQAFNTDIIIYDMSGSVLLRAKSDNSETQRIDLGSLPVGAYWVRSGSQSKMIIKD